MIWNFLSVKINPFVVPQSEKSEVASGRLWSRWRIGFRRKSLKWVHTAKSVIVELVLLKHHSGTIRLLAQTRRNKQTRDSSEVLTWRERKKSPSYRPDCSPKRKKKKLRKIQTVYMWDIGKEWGFSRVDPEIKQFRRSAIAFLLSLPARDLLPCGFVSQFKCQV